MTTEVQTVMTDVLMGTGSELIRFFGLLIVALVVVVPVYRSVSKHRLERMKHETERDAALRKHETELEQARADREAARVNEIITVIQTNTEAFHRIQTLVDIVGARSDDGHTRLHARIDEVLHYVKDRTKRIPR